MSKLKIAAAIIFLIVGMVSCNEQQTSPTGRYELLPDLTVENMSLQGGEDFITDLISENPLFAFVFSDTNFSWKDLLPSELIIQDSTMEFIDAEGVPSSKVMYTYKKINDAVANLVLETGDTLEFVSQKDYYILKMWKLDLYFKKLMTKK